MYPLDLEPLSSQCPFMQCSFLYALAIIQRQQFEIVSHLGHHTVGFWF